MGAVLEASSLEQANLIVGIVGALGTIVALVIAIVLGMHEARRFRHEAAQRESERIAREEAQKRSQAERVSAVIRVSPEPRQQHRLQGGELRDEKVHYAYADVLNSSALPIYGAKVLYPNPAGDRVAVIAVGFVPGGEKGHVHLPPQPDGALDGSPVEVVFRDAAERWWSRCPEGHLYRYQTEPYAGHECD